MTGGKEGYEIPGVGLGGGGGRFIYKSLRMIDQQLSHSSSIGERTKLDAALVPSRLESPTAAKAGLARLVQKRKDGFPGGHTIWKTGSCVTGTPQIHLSMSQKRSRIGYSSLRSALQQVNSLGFMTGAVEKHRKLLTWLSGIIIVSAESR